MKWGIITLENFEFLTVTSLCLGVNIAAIYILAIVMPDILTVWEIPSLIVFAGIYAVVLLRVVEKGGLGYGGMVRFLCVCEIVGGGRIKC